MAQERGFHLEIGELQVENTKRFRYQQDDGLGSPYPGNTDSIVTGSIPPEKSRNQLRYISTGELHGSLVGDGGTDSPLAWHGMIRRKLPDPTSPWEGKGVTETSVQCSELSGGCQGAEWQEGADGRNAKQGQEGAPAKGCQEQRQSSGIMPLPVCSVTRRRACNSQVQLLPSLAEANRL